MTTSVQDETERPPSTIRHKLRSWSEQQAQKKAKLQAAGEGVPVTENGAPNLSSLFLEQSSTYYENVDEDEHDDLMGSNRFKMEPGDAVELLRVAPESIGATQLYIYIRSIGTQDQFISEDGRWIATSIVRHKSFPVQGLVDPVMLEPLFPYLPQEPLTKTTESHGMVQTVTAVGDIPSDIAAPLVEKLGTLKEDILAFRRENILLMEKTNDLLAHEEHFVVLTMDECAEKLFGKPISEMSKGAQFAFFKELEKDPLGCQICKRPDHVFKLILTPKRMVRNFEKVREWAREYQDAAARAASGNNIASSLANNPLDAFIGKARRIILKSRKIRSPTTIGTLGPSTTHKRVEGTVTRADAGETFTESDNMIIEFIWNTFMRIPKVRFNGAAESIGSLILRAIGAYPSLRLEDKIGRLLLQELGVKAPWAEMADEDVLLPVPGRRGGRQADELFKSSEKLVRELGLDVPPHETNMEDTMAHLRHDWGSLKAFCLDGAAADVLDDAFSIETCDDIPGAHWLHTHIAHPSAYITPDHLFSKRARYFGETLYTFQQFYPMLPHYFGMAVCIGPNRPCLTLSTLILPSGEVKDIKLRPSIIREIVHLDPRAVDYVLGKRDTQVADLVVGGTRKKKVDLSTNQIDQALQHREFLELALDVCQRRMTRRLEEVPEVYNSPYYDTNYHVWVSSTNSDFNQDIGKQSQHYLGDPVIHLSSSRFERKDTSVDRHKVDALSAQVMSITSELAAKWCRDREIPAIYQCSLAQPGYSPSKLSNLKSNELKLEPKQTLSSIPKPHTLLNVNQYMRFTSPIRRYTDLIAQWQIDAYLREEGTSSNRKIGYDSTGILPFARTQLDDYIHNNQQTTKDLGKLMTRSENHWTYQALFRAFHFKEATLPEVWDFCVERLIWGDKTADAGVNLIDTGLRGRLIPFHVPNVRLMKSEEGWEKSAVVAQYLPVKIEKVDLYIPSVIVKAVGPPSDEPTTTHPVDIKANIDPTLVLSTSDRFDKEETDPNLGEAPKREIYKTFHRPSPARG